MDLLTVINQYPALSGVLFQLLYLVLAVVTLFTVLRILDRLLGEKFRERSLPIICSDPLALAVYRGAWTIGVCLLAGLMLGSGGIG